MYLSLDINECSIDNGGCTETCVNTNGSYYCTCNAGYTLKQDQHSCKGIYMYTYSYIISVT